MSKKARRLIDNYVIGPIALPLIPPAVLLLTGARQQITPVTIAALALVLSSRFVLLDTRAERAARFVFGLVPFILSLLVCARAAQAHPWALAATSYVGTGIGTVLSGVSWYNKRN